MIKINKCETADSRTCNFADVNKEQLKQSSISHIQDVRKGIDFICDLLQNAAQRHDDDKLYKLDEFHENFVTNFKTDDWWKRHIETSRHHLQHPEGIPCDVDLIDVLEMVVDCVMAGMARRGEVYPIAVPSELLQRALSNTVELLSSNTIVQQE